MTPEQEQIVTFLFVKYGGFKVVVDMWLFSESDLTTVEFDAIDTWLKSEQGKPYNLQVVKDGDIPYITLDIDLNQG